MSSKIVLAGEKIRAQVIFKHLRMILKIENNLLTRVKNKTQSAIIR